MYDSLVLYLRQKNIRLENYMFRAVLKSLNRRKDGDSVRSANSWAYQFEILGHVGDGTAGHPDDEKAKKELAKYSREVWKFYQKENGRERIIS